MEIAFPFFLACTISFSQVGCFERRHRCPGKQTKADKGKRRRSCQAGKHVTLLRINQYNHWTAGLFVTYVTRVPYDQEKRLMNIFHGS